MSRKFLSLWCCWVLMPGWLLAQMGTVQANIQGTDATCFDRNDGIFRVKLLAGTVPVIFSFKNNVNGAIGYRAFANVGQTVVLDSLFRGDYTFTFFEADGKKTILSGNLNSPPLLTAAFSAQGDKCFGENAGQLAVTSVAGGVNPYRYALDNNPAGTQSFWTNLTPGPYFLTVVDAVGCTRQAGAFLPVGTQFILDVGADTSIFSGDTLRYQLAANQVLASVSWSPSRYAQPIGADAVVLSPFSTTTFHAYATDTAGCVATDEVTVIVHRLRNVYLPNVFAPDSHDPVNRTFTVFTGGGVDRVESLRIFDQAARLMFLREQFAPNDPDQGWDGNFQGKRLLAGVFVYQAVVRYTDGRTEEFTGDLTLLR